MQFNQKLANGKTLYDYIDFDSFTGVDASELPPENFSTNDIKAIFYLKDTFTINWCITRWCNYNCPYCISKDTRLKNYSWISETQVLFTAKKIAQLVKVNNITSPIKLQLIGGEVTYYDIRKILNILQANLTNKISLHITTNLSQSVDYFKDLLSYCEEHQIWVSLTCSYHAENKEFFSKFDELNDWYLMHKKFKSLNATFIIDNVFNKEFTDKLIYYSTEKNWKVSLDRLIDINDENTRAVTSTGGSAVKDFIKHFRSLTKKQAVSQKLYDPMYLVILNNGQIKTIDSNIILFLSSTKEGGFYPNNHICFAPNSCIVVEPDGSFYSEFCPHYEKNKKNLFTDNLIFSKEEQYCNAKHHCRMCLAHSVVRKD